MHREPVSMRQLGASAVLHGVAVPQCAKTAYPSSRSTDEYVLTVTPQLCGDLGGSITFTAPDGRYIWYKVEIPSEPPPAERRLEVSAPLRKCPGNWSCNLQASNQ